VNNLSAKLPYASLLGVSVLILATSPLSAQTSTPVASPTPIEVSAPGARTDITQKATIKDKMTSQLSTKKEAFKEKLSSLKDLKKKTTVEKIDTRMSEINTKRTTQMSQALTRMTALLTDLTSKSALAKEQGQDASKLNLAILSAQTAVSTAQTAVITQAAKEYTVTITTEGALKTSVGATVKTLQTDLRSTHASVVNAKQKVQLSIKELRKLNGKSTDKDASSSASSE